MTFVLMVLIIMYSTKLDDGGIRLAKALEGVRSCVYDDGAGYPTIGIGHLIKPGEKFTCLNDKEVEALFHKDLQRFYKAVVKLNINFTQEQFDALVSFAFNIGVKGFESSETYTQLKAGRLTVAAHMMLNWSTAGGRYMAGLRMRRIVEATLFLGKETQHLREARQRLSKRLQARIKKLLDIYYGK